MRRIILVLNVMVVLAMASCGSSKHAKHDRRQHDNGYSNRDYNNDNHHNY